MTETQPPKTDTNFDDIERLFQDPEPDQNIERVSNRLFNLILKNMIIPTKIALAALPLNRKPLEPIAPIKLSLLFPIAKTVRTRQDRDQKQPDMGSQLGRITPESVPVTTHSIDLNPETITRPKKIRKGVLVTQTAAKQPAGIEPKSMIESLKAAVPPLQKKKARKTEPQQKVTEPKEAAMPSDLETKSDGDLDSRFEARQKKIQKLVSKEKGSVT